MLSTSSKELGTRHQTPTLIGCIFLMNRITKQPEFSLLSRLSCDQLSLELYTGFYPAYKQNLNFLAPTPPRLPKEPKALSFQSPIQPRLLASAVFLTTAAPWSEALDYSTSLGRLMQISTNLRFQPLSPRTFTLATSPEACQGSDCHSLRKADESMG